MSLLRWLLLCERVGSPPSADLFIRQAAVAGDRRRVGAADVLLSDRTRARQTDPIRFA